MDRRITLAFVGSNPEREIVEALRALPALESLYLSAPLMAKNGSLASPRASNRGPRIEIPDGSLAQILNDHKLKLLAVDGFILSENDCQAIGQHETLEQLEIIDASLSNESLGRLLLSPRLRRLVISMSDLKGEEIAVQAGSAMLESMLCRLTSVGNGLGLFAARCPKLTLLQVDGPGIDDRFVANLGVHPSLEQLSLPNTSITDQSIATISQMKSLRGVSLPRSSVSQQAVSTLKQARPRLVVVY